MFEKTKARLDQSVKQPVRNALIIGIFAAILGAIALIVAVSK